MNTRSSRQRALQAQPALAAPPAACALSQPAAPTLGRAFAYLASSAALSRGVPFLVNVAVARRLTPTQLGVPTVHFALVSTLVLTAREGFRRACLRGDTGDTAALAVSWLAVPAGAIVACAVACAARAALGAAVMSTPYGAAVLTVCAAAFLELCAEPFHLAATRHGALAVRLLAEAASTFSRAGVVAWLLLAPSRQGRPLAVEQSFAAAHCAGAAALLLAYAAGAALQPRAVWPGAPSAPTRASLLLLRDFSAQALWKLALAEGDKAVLLAWRAPDATGVYGLASNLGGLAARILLQPLEEAAYAMFAASAAGGRSKDALAALLRVLLLVSCFSAAVGPSFAFLVLRCMYGTRWATAPGAAATLGAYAVLLPLLAVNGVSEAYTAAVMTPVQLRAANGTLLAAAVTQAAVAVACKPLGAAALVAGTAAGMALRIAASLRFVVAAGSRHTSSSLHTPGSLVALLPHAWTVCVFVVCASVAAVSDGVLRRAPAFAPAAAQHLTVGGATALAACAAVATWEWPALLAAGATLRRVREKRH